MFIVAVVTLVCVAVAGLVLFYAAYPSRGQQPPQAGEWLSEVMTRAVEAVPTIEEHEDVHVRG